MLLHATRSSLLVAVIPIVVAACAAAPEPAPTAPTIATPRADGCAGGVAAAPAGATPVDDPALLASARGEPGKGKLCTGQVFQATAAVEVYRVWDGSKTYTELGSWWSLSKPSGPRDAYRLENNICPEWSALDQLSRCTIKVGAKFVLGPGQSATCQDGQELPGSKVNQVFVPNDTRKGEVYVEGCEKLGPWP